MNSIFILRLPAFLSGLPPTSSEPSEASEPFSWWNGSGACERQREGHGDGTHRHRHQVHRRPRRSRRGRVSCFREGLSRRCWAHRVRLGPAAPADLRRGTDWGLWVGDEMPSVGEGLGGEAMGGKWVALYKGCTRREVDIKNGHKGYIRRYREPDSRRKGRTGDEKGKKLKARVALGGETGERL